MQKDFELQAFIDHFAHFQPIVHKTDIEAESKFFIPYQVAYPCISHLALRGSIDPTKERTSYHFSNSEHSIHLSLDKVLGSLNQAILEYLEIEANSPEKVIAFVEFVSSFIPSINMRQASGASLSDVLKERNIQWAKIG